MKIELAQFEHHHESGNAITCVHPRSHEGTFADTTVRVSEYVEVEFTPRDPEEIATLRRQVLAAKREKLAVQLAKLDAGEPA